MKRRIVIFMTRSRELEQRGDPATLALIRSIEEAPDRTLERHVVAQPVPAALDWLGRLGFTRPVGVQRAWTGATLQYFNGPAHSDYDTAVLVTSERYAGVQCIVYFMPTRADAVEFYYSQIDAGGEGSRGVAVTEEMVDKAAQRQGSPTRPWKRTRHRKHVHAK